jgi:HEPN domain-containing protein
MAKSWPTNPVTIRDAERLVKAARRVLLTGGYPNLECC